MDADKIRLRLSNAFGVNELPISKVTLARPVGGQAGVSALEPGTVKELSFDGQQGVIIPNGAQAVSDPIHYPVKSETNLMINIYLKDGQEGFLITGHPGSRTTSYLQFGDAVDAHNLTDSAVASTAHW